MTMGFSLRLCMFYPWLLLSIERCNGLLLNREHGRASSGRVHYAQSAGDFDMGGYASWSSMPQGRRMDFYDDVVWNGNDYTGRNTRTPNGPYYTFRPPAYDRRSTPIPDTGVGYYDPNPPSSRRPPPGTPAWNSFSRGPASYNNNYRRIIENEYTNRWQMPDPMSYRPDTLPPQPPNHWRSVPSNVSSSPPPPPPPPVPEPVTPERDETDQALMNKIEALREENRRLQDQIEQSRNQLQEELDQERQQNDELHKRQFHQEQEQQDQKEDMDDLDYQNRVLADRVESLEDAVRSSEGGSIHLRQGDSISVSTIEARLSALEEALQATGQNMEDDSMNLEARVSALEETVSNMLNRNAPPHHQREHEEVRFEPPPPPPPPSMLPNSNMHSPVGPMEDANRMMMNNNYSPNYNDRDHDVRTDSWLPSENRRRGVVKPDTHMMTYGNKQAAYPETWRRPSAASDRSWRSSAFSPNNAIHGPKIAAYPETWRQQARYMANDS